MNKFLLILILIGAMSSAQVGINTDKPDPSSILDVQSETGGVLFPRMTLEQKLKIDNPAEGLLIYQKDTLQGFYFYSKDQWVSFKSMSVSSDHVVTVDTVGELSGLVTNCVVPIKTAIVLGYHSKHDGGGGVFHFETSLCGTTDGGLVFDGWKRSVIDSAINVKWFGARSKENADGRSDTVLRSENSAAFKEAVDAVWDAAFASSITNVTDQIMSGVFIPSGIFLIGDNALFSNTDTYGPPNNITTIERLGKKGALTFYSDGNGVLDVKSGSGHIFENKNNAITITFRDLTFLGRDACNLLASSSNGSTQDYYFDRCNFYGDFGTIFTVRSMPDEGDTNSEWGFNKCNFTCDVVTVMDIEGSDQFVNYWFDQTKFWIEKGKTLILNNGGHVKFNNCDWSGLSPTAHTYQFELNNPAGGPGVNDFRIINGRFELGEHARVLKSNWSNGNIEITADFGSQTWQRYFKDNPNSIKHFEFDLSSEYFNSLNVNFRNSVMMGGQITNYGSNSWRGTGRIKYENCSFPNRTSLDGFIQVNNNNVNRTGGAIIEIENAIFERNRLIGISADDTYPLEIPSVNYLPLYSNSGVKVKHFKIAHAARGTSPLNNQKYILNFPEEAESVITRVIWKLPQSAVGSITPVKFELQDIEGNTLSESVSNPAPMWMSFNKIDEVFIEVKNLKEGKLVLTDSTGNADQTTEKMICIIEYY